MLRSVVSAAAVTLLVAVALSSTVGVAAAEDVTLEVTVVDEDDRPVDDVDLVVTWDDGEGGPKRVTTTADGRALVDVPEGATVRIDTDDDEYVRNRPFRVFDVGSGEKVEVRVTEIGRATFVVEGADGRVPGAEIDIRQPGTNVGTLTTNESGVARSGPLELGDYTARVTAPGHLQEQVSFEVTRVEKTETISVQRADVDVTVTVVDDRLDPPQPVGNAQVRFTDLGSTLTTNSNGRVTASVPVNQGHRVRVTKDGYDATRRTVSVAEQQTSLEVAIQREPSLSLESVNRRVVVGESTVVTVTDEYGEPVEGATVSVGAGTVGETDTQGQIRVPIDAVGEVTIEATDGDTTATITVEGVDPDATPTPTVTPTPTATEMPGTPTPTPGGSGPGFGPVAALLAVLGAGLLARRR